MVFLWGFLRRPRSVPDFCAALRQISLQDRIERPLDLLPSYCAYLVLASFSMLCTMQCRFHCVLTFVRPPWFKRVRRLLCRMLPNTGSTVPMRWL